MCDTSFGEHLPPLNTQNPRFTEAHALPQHTKLLQNQEPNPHGTKKGASPSRAACGAAGRDRPRGTTGTHFTLGDPFQKGTKFDPMISGKPLRPA